MEYELEGLCGKLFDLLDDHLMPKVDHVDARVFYLKVQCSCDGEGGGEAQCVVVGVVVSHGLCCAVYR